jgi:nicotinamidase-related amidase
VDKGDNDSELDSKHYPVEFPFMPGKAALVIIDAWEHHPNEGYLWRAKNNMRTKLLPLLTLARRNKLPIIHASHEKEIAKIVKPIRGEFVIDITGDKASDKMKAILDKEGIHTLLYAGYATDICVLTRAKGIKNMHKSGYRIILVRDATIAFENAETLSGEWRKNFL